MHQLEPFNEAHTVSFELPVTIEAASVSPGVHEQKQREATAACCEWNAVLDAHDGSFADQYSPL
ncbi:MAG: hypothetical protein QM772_00915 [Ottowia sp.]|uniref:hypothetical protein n=1 Tax=Ottowia sp. TaxID=1898956 RepID=UPI0039E2FB1F